MQHGATNKVSVFTSTIAHCSDLATNAEKNDHFLNYSIHGIP